MQHLANALLTTLAIPILNASQNVWSTLSVPETRLVSVRSVEILALVYVGLMHIAQPQTTMPSANVILATQAMPLLHVRELQHVSLELL